jgi:hypothetical protein
MSKAFQQLERETSTRAPNVIKTPGLFSMMELPAELRIKVHSLYWFHIDEEGFTKTPRMKQSQITDALPDTPSPPSAPT